MQQQVVLVATSGADAHISAWCANRLRMFYTIFVNELYRLQHHRMITIVTLQCNTTACVVCCVLSSHFNPVRVRFCISF